MAAGRPAPFPAPAARITIAARLLLATTVLMLASCSAPAPPTQTVTGVLLDVRASGLQKLDEFTLRTDDGQEMTFAVSPDFNQGASHPMTPGHMRQHMALADPVEVTYRDEGGRLVALSAADATPAPTPAT